ncbi:MAG: hypothetical protein H0X61_03650 [Acidimicrobiia bacterium]|jgi:hypothetical protein|nr:hypothetical protein [Acidimicrobiia bacterium]MBA3982615.1 hypothetical protein [Acidimicrobiia bacterium]
MSDSIWNYRDDVNTRRSEREDDRDVERSDEFDSERDDQFDSSGVPMPPPASPTDAPLVDDPQSDPMVTDSPLAGSSGTGSADAGMSGSADAGMSGSADAGMSSMGDADAQGIEIVGYDVEATDGGLGKVDESSLEAGSAYVVVDTGWWIFGKKRMIPAGVIESIDHENGQVFVGLSKEEIKSAPDFAEEHREDRSGYDEYYEPYGR